MVQAEGIHARHRLKSVLNAPVRLSVMATLTAVHDIEFAVLRDTVEVTDSVLSKQLSTLESEGYVRLEKGYVGKRPRTWISSTKPGRQAFADHVAALQEMLRVP